MKLGGHFICTSNINISQCEKERLNRLTKRGSRMIGIEQTGVCDTYRAPLPHNLHTVWTDVSHTLHDLLSDQVIVLRLRPPSFHNKTRHPLSFAPLAIRCHNNSFKR